MTCKMHFPVSPAVWHGRAWLLSSRIGKHCVWLSGLANKLPHQVCFLMEVVSPVCPGSYSLNMTEMQLSWVPEKVHGASSLLFSPALKSCFRTPQEKDLLLCTRYHIFGHFYYTSYPNQYGNNFSFIFFYTSYKGAELYWALAQWWLVDQQTPVLAITVSVFRSLLHLQFVMLFILLVYITLFPC